MNIHKMYIHSVAGTMVKTPNGHTCNNITYFLLPNKLWEHACKDTTCHKIKA